MKIQVIVSDEELKVMKLSSDSLGETILDRLAIQVDDTELIEFDIEILEKY